MQALNNPPFALQDVIAPCLSSHRCGYGCHESPIAYADMLIFARNIYGVKP